MGGSSAGTSKDKEKTASKLLSTKKEKKPVNPNYKPAKRVVRLVQNVTRYAERVKDT